VVLLLEENGFLRLNFHLRQNPYQNGKTFSKWPGLITPGYRLFKNAEWIID
jgi:hypothetical protein